MQDVSAIDELEKRVAQHPRPAILWTRSGIPNSGDCTSYFGGLPRLPPNLEWPRLTLQNPIDGSPFLGSPTFIGQLDFANIDAAFTRTQRLPTKGVAYFFCDGAQEYRVLFAPEGCTHYPERAPPADLMRLAGHRYCSGRDWRADDEAWSRVDFRYAIVPHAFSSYRGWHEWPHEEEHQYREAYDRVQVAALEQVFGPIARYPLPEQKDWDDQYGWARLLFPSWPISRLFYEEFHRALDYELTGGDGLGHYKPPTEEAGPASIQFHEQMKADLAYWSAELGGRDMSEALPAGLRDDIRNWFLKIRARAHELNYGEQKVSALPPFRISEARDESMWLAANITLATGKVGGVDAETIRTALKARIESWQSPIYSFDPSRPIGMRDISRPMHQTLGYGEQCQSAAQDRVNDVLLFQVSGDGLGWQGRFDAMLLQFWIKPQDLAAKRFDRVEMTAECD